MKMATKQDVPNPITKKREFFVCLIAATSAVMHTRTVTLCGSVPRDETGKHDFLAHAFHNYSRCFCLHPCHPGAFQTQHKEY